MAVPTPPVLASAVSGLLLLLFAVLGFAIVAGVAAVILALLQAILPSADTGAEAVHRAELERTAAAAGEGGRPADEEPSDPAA